VPRRWSALTEGGQHAPLALSGWAAGSDLGSSLAVVGLVATAQGGLQARRAVLRVVEPRSRLCTAVCCCGCARARSELPWWALEVRGSWGFSPALAPGRAAPLDCCRAVPRPWFRGLLVFPLGALLGALVTVALHGAGCTPVPGDVWLLFKPLACACFAAVCFVLSWVGEHALLQGREARLAGEAHQGLLAA
jgi:hypothetical protein